MSTRDDPKKISDRSVRYKRRVDKKEDQLDDPSEQDQKKGKGKGKKQVPLLPVVAPPQTRRPAESPPTHEAYIPGYSRSFHTVLELPNDTEGRVQTVVHNFEGRFESSSSSPIWPTTLFRDPNPVSSSGGPSRGGGGGDSPSPPGSPRGGTTLSPKSTKRRRRSRSIRSIDGRPVGKSSLLY
ncbi:hypothetical protein AXG93_1856s1010 [Marchantia polymorpha subsp. ruderalis]|uniref:Uncharacterized protein n=1 Tax=Marchantia polymorpha subsp. ruderalis TaxID=1480154 RepID=A0A176VS28_MARPO|nr:hypothetical protein AXG93_1856s1010 [Marchantia polymorpha subsp. ruderalis]